MQVAAVQAPLAVAQQVMLFCAEQAAQLAIDELVAESAQLVSEDASPDASASRQLSARDLDDIPSFSLPVVSTPFPQQRTKTAWKCTSGVSALPGKCCHQQSNISCTRLPSLCRLSACEA